MATSIGEGAARGLEAGFRMGQGFIEQRDREEQRKLQQQQAAADRAERAADTEFQRSRLLAQDARLAKQDYRQTLQDERQQAMDAEAALDAEFKDLQNEGKGLFEQYGDMSKIPPDLADSYTLRVKDTRGRLTEARAKRYAPLVEAERNKASQLWSRIQTGQIPIEQVPDEDLVKSLTALTRRDITEFLPMSGGIDGGPSMVQQAGMDFMAGAESGNDEMMIGAANVLFKPELMIGVGGPGRDGSEILSKKIVQLIPHPQDPTQFTPLLEIKVRREDGKVGTYRAPVTENRSSDPEDNIRTISMQDGLERVGQLTTLAQALNQRGIIEKIANGMNNAGEGPANFLEAYYATGGTKPKAEKVDIGHFEEVGDEKWHFLPDGRVVKYNNRKTKQGGDTGGETGAVMRNLNAALKDGTITRQEYDTRKRAIVLGTEKGKGSGNATEDERKAAGWLSQARFAFENMESAIAEDPSAAEPGLAQELAGAIPKVGPALKNAMTSEARQKFEQASSSFAEAALRAATGAGVTEAEAKQKIRELTPQIGDKPGTRAQKRQALEVYLQSLESRAGRAAADARPAGVRKPPEPAAAQRQPSPLNAAQPGVDMGPSRVPARPQQFKEGDTIVNRQTGQRMQMRGGQWQPI